MAERGLDFVVIGAQKAGTTTVFHHLRDHPQIAMPPDKEAPFFSRADLYPKGADWFMDHFFPGADPARLLGKVSPQYMCVPGTAARLAAAFPDVKLVAVLRDPVDRARSHHTMAVRRGVEHRPFADAITTQLEPENLVAAREAGLRGYSALPETYVAWGEYGRVLAEYLDAFPRHQVHVAFTTDLARDPEAVVAEIQEFLGVERIAPSTLGRNYHVGDTEPRFTDLHRLARTSRAARGLWRRLPLKYRNRIHFEYWERNVRPVSADRRASPPSSETVAGLRRHYWSDEEQLARLLGITVPWPRQQPVVS